MADWGAEVRLPDLDGVRAAAATIAPYHAPTPLVRSELLSRAFDAEVWLKNETVGPVASFKLRGALNALVLGAQAALGNLVDQGPLALFVAAVPLNFYSIVAVVLVFFVSATGWHIGPMKEAERRAAEEGKVLRDGARPFVDDEVISIPRKPEAPPRLDNMLVPLVAMVLMVFAGIAVTGMAGVRAAGIQDAGLMDYLNQASGSTSVLWAVLLALALMAVMSLTQGIFSVQEYVDLSFKGAGACCRWRCCSCWPSPSAPRAARSGPARSS